MRAAAATCLVLALVGCQAVPEPSGTPTTPTASATAEAIDLTKPGAAQQVVRDLVRAAGTSKAIMVDIAPQEASLSVLVDGTARTWAYRGGQIKEVASDLTYVDQITFDPASYNLSDVGALLRAAAAVSGSEKAQELQIVDRQMFDHSADEVYISVSTNPETRTVFFKADGTLVPTLDFNTAHGIAAGLADAIGSHAWASVLVVGSATGAYIDFTGPDAGTTARRQRTARFPVTVSLRNETDRQLLFDPAIVNAAVIWEVVQRQVATGAFGPTATWSVTASQATGTTAPRLQFTIGSARLVTDLSGTEVKG